LELADWDTFEKRHAENVAVFWLGQPNLTRGMYNHRAESIESFKAFPDNHIVNNPYKILFANGDFIPAQWLILRAPLKGQ
jgi:hypothetical protein